MKQFNAILLILSLFMISSGANATTSHKVTQITVEGIQHSSAANINCSRIQDW